MKKYFILIGLFLFVNNSYSAGLLGKNYIGVSLGTLSVKDEETKKIDDAITLLGATWNIMLSPRTDIFFNYASAKIKGALDYTSYYEGIIIIGEAEVEAKSHGGSLGMLHHFKPSKKFDPYISAHIGFLSSETKVDGRKLENEGFDLAAGIELGLEARAVDISFIGSIAYSKVENSDDFGLSLSMAEWLLKSIYIQLGIGYLFDDGDVLYKIGAGFAL